MRPPKPRPHAGHTFLVLALGAVMTFATETAATDTAPTSASRAAGTGDPGGAFAGALLAPEQAPHPGLGSDLYTWLIGSWDAEVTDYPEDGPARTSQGEWHFAWVLEGRAIQDVWISPPRGRRRPDDPPAPGNRYGTSVRVYDAARDAWRVTWINPVTGVENRLAGRRSGDDVVQIGVEPDGTLLRWTFTDIRPDAFLWRGEASPDGGATWRLQAEFRLRRRIEG